MVRTALALSLALAGLAAAAPASAQPGGSYTRSCRVTDSGGGRLTAECTAINGRRRTSTIEAGRCTGDIGNTDGLLTCNGATARETSSRGRDDDRFGEGGYGGRGGSPPRGSYSRTCRDARIERDLLVAQCGDRSGRYRSSAVVYRDCRGDIGNNDGRLVCDGGASRAYQDRRDDRDGYGFDDRDGDRRDGRDRYDRGPR